MSKREIRRGFDRTRVILKTPGKGKTEQGHTDLCDINKIMGKYKRTGVLTHLNMKSPLYGDFTGSVDFQSAQNQVIAAQAHFDALPASIRERMKNDPQELVNFMADPANKEEAEELGLINAPKVHPDQVDDQVKTPESPEAKPPEKPGAEAPKT